MHYIPALVCGIIALPEETNCEKEKKQSQALVLNSRFINPNH